MVRKFCEIWIFYGKCLPDGPNSVRFYLTVWDMACMSLELAHQKTHKKFCDSSEYLQEIFGVKSQNNRNYPLNTVDFHYLKHW